jgi:5-methylcytosine-specific restriction endonuclease McrA
MAEKGSGTAWYISRRISATNRGPTHGGEMTDAEREYHRKYQAQWRIANRDRLLALRRANRLANIAKYLAKERANASSHRVAKNARERARRTTDQGETIRAKDRAYYAANGDHFKKYRAEHKAAITKTKRAWVLSNKGAMRAIRFKRIAAEHQALPVWANLAAIKAIYEEAARLTHVTGIKHEVDHIVPIQSPVVCGLHWEANMQILTKAENRRKSNTLTPHTTQPRSPGAIVLP